jgi:cyanophycinase
MRPFLVFTFIILSAYVSYGQGKFVVVGGGGESEGGWSDAPYTWGVNKAANKRVAVISYANEDDWIPNYFKSLGAVAADNIKIDSRALADTQAMYDSLMLYDMFFFKGGDQSYYYTYYKGTKTQEAIHAKFAAGGVMAGTSAGLAILSSLSFTGTNGSAFPYQAVYDYSPARFSLADDFLQLFSGYVFDSHFTERGRFPRLMAFMAKWYKEKDSLIKGMGVDDRTAICIDDALVGTVYGTGGVSIFSPSAFQTSTNRMVNDSIHTTQLLHGHTYDFKTQLVAGISSVDATPTRASETGNYTLVLTGAHGNGYPDNAEAFSYFLNSLGNPKDSVILVTSAGKGTTFKTRLNTVAVPWVLLETTTANNREEQIDLRNAIRSAKKIVFVENDDAQLKTFLQGKTGTLLNEHIRRNQRIVCFIGEDARLAGVTYTSNHFSDMYAAYYGRLKYETGLGLLKSSTIMPNAFEEGKNDYFENTTAAIPYALVKSTLKYGVYLNKGGFLVYHQENDKNYFHSLGTASSIILVNNSTMASEATQATNTAGAVRNYVAFESMHYVLLNGNKMEVGIPTVSVDVPYAYEQHVVAMEHTLEKLLVYPNPTNDVLFLKNTQEPLLAYSIVDITGKEVYKHTNFPITHIDLSSLPAGFYTIHLSFKKKCEVIKAWKQTN